MSSRDFNGIFVTPLAGIRSLDRRASLLRERSWILKLVNAFITFLLMTEVAPSRIAITEVAVEDILISRPPASAAL
ncbi:MAG: hypothetical protein OXE94_05325 [Aestuariivita sp.]|nr:hypothetical protein [Aestuariivita sp.]MCY4202002.1 hypothetical protein [Aestuariivita sp.]MCY4288188.1 hypothetical protein [Aestuariivita sp.]MCY4346247.1 hypothetical protein [Aestuariivita sp.]